MSRMQFARAPYTLFPNFAFKQEDRSIPL